MNLASRLQEFAEKNQIIISRETKNIIGNKFNIKEMSVTPNSKIKGFEYIKEYYQIIK